VARPKNFNFDALSDKFGIARPGTLLGETVEQRNAREGAVLTLIHEVSRLAAYHLLGGADAARKAFENGIAEYLGERRGAHAGSRNTERDEYLVREFDRMIAEGSATTRAEAARLLYNGPHRETFQLFSVSAVGALLRRLLNRRALAAEEARNTPRTLLSAALAEGMGKAVAPRRSTNK
jgi:hypothetical protein